jgi:hypothetical protein|tara:strand:+ start:3167 stop:3634 length:468 start_codon:yes stop_codon:yes gene_type:complete
MGRNELESADNEKISASNIGSAGELMTALELIIRGWDVYTQTICNTTSVFDLIATKGPLTQRIQVKSTARKYSRGENRRGQKHILKINRRKNGKKVLYDKSDCDFIVIAALDEGWFFVIPTEKIHCQTVNIYTNQTGQATGWIAEYKNAWDLLEV